MDGTLMGGHHHPTTPFFGSPAPQETEPRFGMTFTLDAEVETLRREKECVLRILSRNGQGTISDIKTVAERVVQHRDQLRVENQEL